MGLRTSTPTPVAPAAAATPVAATPKAIVAANAPVAKKTEVKGQVAMHAIKTGYEVASHLAATLAASPEKVEEKLHALAHEVAARIEEYTFKGE